MGFADKIRSAREEKGLTKNALAELALLSPTYLDKIEKGDSVPTIEVAARIKNVLGLTAEAFFEGLEAEVLTPAKVDVAIEQRTQNLCELISSSYDAGAIADIKKFRFKDKIALLEYLKMFETNEAAESPSKKGKGK